MYLRIFFLWLAHTECVLNCLNISFIKSFHLILIFNVMGNFEISLISVSCRWPILLDILNNLILNFWVSCYLKKLFLPGVETSSLFNSEHFMNYIFNYFSILFASILSQIQDVDPKLYILYPFISFHYFHVIFILWKVFSNWLQYFWFNFLLPKFCFLLPSVNFVFLLTCWYFYYLLLNLKNVFTLVQTPCQPAKN